MMTKAEEKLALDIMKEHIQKKFIRKFGFAPLKKDIKPLECAYSKQYAAWIVDSMGFHINGIGWSISGSGELERAECYDMK